MYWKKLISVSMKLIREGCIEGRKSDSFCCCSCPYVNYCRLIDHDPDYSRENNLVDPYDWEV